MPSLLAAALLLGGAAACPELAAAEAPAVALVAEDGELAGEVARALAPGYPEVRWVESRQEAARLARAPGGPSFAVVVSATRRLGSTQVHGVELATCRLLAAAQILSLPSSSIEASHRAEATAPDCAAALDQAAPGLIDQVVRSLALLSDGGQAREPERDQLWVELPDEWPPAQREGLLRRLAGLPGVLGIAEDPDPHFVELEVMRDPMAMAAEIDRLESVRVARFRRGRRIVVRPESARADVEMAGEKMSLPLGQLAKVGAEGDPRRWALVVGVSSFGDASIPALSYPVKDAEQFARVLVEDARFPEDQVKVLTDRFATTRRVKMEIDYLARLTRPEDLFLFFISTHAVPGVFDTAGDAYLVTHDTESASLYATGFPMRELVLALSRRIRARTVVGFLDACHTGQVVSTSGAEVPEIHAEGIAPAEPSRTLVSWSTQWEDLAAKSLPALPAPTATLAPDEIKRIVIISSSDGNQPSWESEKLGHGVFTYYLMTHLRQTGGRILLSELFDRLGEDVNRSVQREKGRFQEPRMFVSKNADFWIAGGSGTP